MIGIRVLTTLAEIDWDTAQNLRLPILLASLSYISFRIIAYVLEQMNEYEIAINVYNRIIKLRGEHPQVLNHFLFLLTFYQSYLDAGTSYSNRAISILKNKNNISHIKSSIIDIQEQRKIASELFQKAIDNFLIVVERDWDVK